MSFWNPTISYQCPKCQIPRTVIKALNGEWMCMNGRGTMFECGYAESDEQRLQEALAAQIRTKKMFQTLHKHCCVACVRSINEHEAEERARLQVQMRDDKIAELERQLEGLKRENAELRREVQRQSAPRRNVRSGRFREDTEAQEDTIEVRGPRRFGPKPRPSTEISTTLRPTGMSKPRSEAIELKQTENFEEEDLLGSPHGFDAAMFSSKFCPDPLGFVRTVLVNSDVSAMLNGIEEWDFDIFSFERMPLLKNHPIVVLGYTLLSRLNYFERFQLNQQKVMNWLTRVESGYRQNPYHNNLHGADVMLSSSFWFKLDTFERMYDDFDRLILILSGAAHDVGHTGTNNKYHRNSASRLAYIYNDQSVLENYHVSFAFRLMKKFPECDWMSDLDKEHQQRARKLMVKMILGTDMEFHNEHVSQLKQIVGQLRGESSESESSVTAGSVDDLSEWEKMNVLVNAFHLGDIGNSCKKQQVCVEWAKRIAEEFRRQGDAEKRNGWGPIDKIFDRSTSLQFAQIGWNKFVVLPYIELFAELHPQARFMVDNCRENLEFWTTFKEQE